MAITLAPGISFCVVDDARIFLDRHRDRYFSLGRLADAAFASIGTRDQSAEDAARLSALVEAGILVDHPFGEAPRPCRPIAITSSPLDNSPYLPASGPAALRSALSIRMAQRELRLRGFAHICRSIERLPVPTRHAGTITEEDLASIAGRFARAKRVAGAFEQCLPIAIAMVRFCRRRDYAAQFVIGIKTRPFQAHAWVSADGVVLSDPAEVAQQFTPILIL